MSQSILTRHLIVMRLVGPEISPERVRAGELGEILKSYETAVLGTVAAEHPLDFDEPHLSLVRIEEGSELLTFSLSSFATSAAGRINSAISGQNFTKLPFRTQIALHDLSKHVVPKDWRIIWPGDSQLSIPPAEISVERPFPKPAPNLIQGETDLFGKILRVGGKPPMVCLELLTSELAYCKVKQDLAQQCGSRLYELVGLRGGAEWNADTWELIGFYARELLPYKETKPTDAFRALAEASKGTWDDLDAESFVEDLRENSE